jgi:hypothetical protein
MKTHFFYAALFICSLSITKTTQAQEILSINGKYAVMNRNNVVLASDFDSIIEDKETYRSRNEFYTFWKNNKCEIVYKNQLETINWSGFSCRFDRIKPAKFGGSTAVAFIVEENGEFGLIDENNVFIIPMGKDSILHSEPGSRFIRIKRGAKYAFLDIVLDVEQPQTLNFAYDHIYLETENKGFINLQTGSKFGCYFTGHNGNKYIRGKVEPNYDEPFKVHSFLLETLKQKKRCYFYLSTRLPEIRTYLESTLYFSDTTEFTDLFSSLSVTYFGKNREEPVMFSYPNLFIDYTNSQGFTTINFTKSTLDDLFDPKSNTSYDLIRLSFPEKSGGGKGGFPVFLYRVNTFQNYEPVQTFYTVDYLDKLFTIQLKPQQTIRFEPYERNTEYMQVLTVSALPDFKGKTKVYKNNGYLSGFYRRVEQKTPESGNSYSGGSHKNNQWMDIFWMGGR